MTDATPTPFGLLISNVNTKEAYLTATYTVPQGCPEGMTPGTYNQVIPPAGQGGLFLLQECPEAMWQFRYSTPEEIEAWKAKEHLATVEAAGRA